MQALRLLSAVNVVALGTSSSLAGLSLLSCHCHLFETYCVVCKGGSIEAIAEAKAGIMKPNRPVVIAKQPYPIAVEVLEQHAKQLNCQIIQPSDYLDLKPKETINEGNSVVQTVIAKPHGLSWMQPTGQTHIIACVYFCSCTCTCTHDSLRLQAS